MGRQNDGNTYNNVDKLHLGDVHGLELIPSRSGTGKARLGRRFHQANLGIEVGEFLVICQSGPGSRISWLLSAYHYKCFNAHQAFRWVGFVQAAEAAWTTARAKTARERSLNMVAGGGIRELKTGKPVVGRRNAQREDSLIEAAVLVNKRKSIPPMAIMLLIYPEGSGWPHPGLEAHDKTTTMVSSTK